MIVREARLTDTPGISALCSQLGYEVSHDEVLKRLEKLTQHDDHAVYVVAKENDHIAGWVHIHGRYLIESAPFAEIGGLVVDQGARRQGIGERLMRKCEEWAKAKGFPQVRVRSGGHRKEAHEFYKRIGYSNVKWQEVFNLQLAEE